MSEDRRTIMIGKQPFFVSQADFDAIGAIAQAERLELKPSLPYLAEANAIEGLEQLHTARKVADPLAFIRDLEEANRQMRELVNRTVHRNYDIHMENLALRRELSRLRQSTVAVDEPPTDAVVSKRIDDVIDDLGKGRVVPKDQNRIADAVGRARTDSAVGRALGKGYQR